LALCATCACLAWSLAAAEAATAQTTGRVFGRIVSSDADRPLAGVLVSVVGLPVRAQTAENGRFVLVGVPVGRRSIRVSFLGHRTVTVEDVRVSAGRGADLGRVVLEPSPIAVEGVVVTADPAPLIEPERTVSHEVVVGRELRALPVDAVDEAVELAAGVTDGHFRGGRIGQEIYVVDGVELKNQLEASSRGFGLEFSPTSLEEIDVITGGFGAEYGAALSGVVRYSTRRGDADRWEGRVAALSDHWAPSSLLTGFSGLSVSAGGPLSGAGTSVFADLFIQGELDADPRARGLTCLRPDEASPSVANLISQIENDARLRGFRCPFERERLPFQEGDKVIGFVRLDQPIGSTGGVFLSVLGNRRQRLLYTPEFKYNDAFQLGQRVRGTLATLGLTWSRSHTSWASFATLRGYGMRIDRHLGAVDIAGLADRTAIAGVRPGAFEFIGEDFVRSPIDDQLASGEPVPGYAAPGGSIGSPFGPAAEGLFFTEGTPDLANWTRSDMGGLDATGELVSAQGSALRAGVSAKLFRVELYERTRAHLSGSTPNFARFFPRSVSSFVEGRLESEDGISVHVGGRLEAFRPGLVFRADREDLDAPVLEPGWETSLSPRIALAGPIPGTDRRTALRLSYGLVTQPPDFRFFFDTTLGDSLRTDIRVQGNPELTFERGTAYEVGVDHLFGESVAVGVTGFRKELGNLATGDLSFGGDAQRRFTTGDFGTVNGVELAVRARWGLGRVTAGYALQKAEGVSTGVLGDTLIDGDEVRIERPLAFDRRHAIDAAVYLGRSSGADAVAWGGAVFVQARSGTPILGIDPAAGSGTEDRFLPWTADVRARVSWSFDDLGVCSRCSWRVVAEGRNLLGRENQLAVRRSTGTLSPSDAEVFGPAADGLAASIPRESPRYSELGDLNRDGLIDADEYARVRLAASLDRFDPSLFFGEPVQVRLGLELSF
jgi:hypothetical protein